MPRSRGEGQVLNFVFVNSRRTQSSWGDEMVFVIVYHLLFITCSHSGRSRTDAETFEVGLSAVAKKAGKKTYNYFAAIQYFAVVGKSIPRCL